MYLCLDVGNSQIHGGFFNDDNLIVDFRLNTKQGWSSDQFGIFLTSFCHTHKIDYTKIAKIAVCSVVPSIDHHLKNTALKYFKQEAFFVKAGVKTGILVNKYKNPGELGADIIAGAVSGIKLFPNQNLLIIDMGTATTITAINSAKEFLGGVIMPGISTQVNSLSSSTEKLFTVDIKKPDNYLGKITTHCIQSGIYFGHLGALRFLISELKMEIFNNEKCLVLATGGFSSLYKNENIYDHQITDLVLKGLIYTINLN